MDVLRNVNRGRLRESGEFGKMAQRRFVVGLVDEIAGEKPIRRNHSEQRGAERAEAERLQTDGHQQPEKRNEEENLHEKQTGDADGEEGRVNRSDGGFVLIGLKEKHVENYDCQTDDSAFDRREKERCHQHQHEERARHHTAVDADERVGVVEFDHQ